MAFKIKGPNLNLNVQIFIQKTISCWEIDRDILSIISVSPKKIAKACITNCLRFSVHRQETTWYRFFLLCASTVLPLSQNTWTIWLFSLYIFVERLFIIVEFWYDCKLNDAKLNKVKYTKDQLTCYFSKNREEWENILFYTVVYN